jgi:hypothetical protein
MQSLNAQQEAELKWLRRQVDDAERDTYRTDNKEAKANNRLAISRSQLTAYTSQLREKGYRI